MVLNKAKSEEIVTLIRNGFFKDWGGFSDPRWIKEEDKYKRDKIEQAQSDAGISEAALRRLVAAGQYDEITQRLKKLATNLLYLSKPSKGDLNILFQPQLDKSTFFQAFFDLLYGEGKTLDRLARYVQYIEAQDIPTEANKWTFPTYFLFLCHPDRELFIKPTAIQWFLDFIGHPRKLPARPDSSTYAEIVQAASELREATTSYGARDMVDVQGLIWNAFKESEKVVGEGLRDKSIIPDHDEQGNDTDELEEEPELPAFGRAYWLWVSRPDAYMDGDGRATRSWEPGVDDPDAWWACQKDTAAGDLVLMWRTLPKSDISYLLEATSDAFSTKDNPEKASRSNYGCRYRVLYKFEHPVTVKELRAHPRLSNSKALKLNFQGSAFAISPEEWADLIGLLLAKNPGCWRALAGLPLYPQPKYELPTLAADTGYSVAELEHWLAALERKKQAILYGPPGTGKTFMAEHLARHLIGGGDGFMELVQFHPAYAYEDFIQGLRPQRTAEGALTYEMVPGRFLEFCDAARTCTGICVLIIDEINRANLARVFGELMYLLEYRDQSAPLAGGNRLSIPQNVRILGTMNTADRSIALVDHALRRRFAFIELQPKYEVLTAFHQRENTGYDPAGLIGVLRDLNTRINDPFYAVGTTFFMHKDLGAQIESIWKMEIEPYLEEFFYGQRDGDLADFRWDQVRGRL